MSHLPVLSHLSLAPSRSRCPSLELSHPGLMRILSWPCSTCKPSVSPLPWSLEHRALYSQPCHLCRGQTQAITSGSSRLSYPGGHLTFLQRGPGNIWRSCHEPSQCSCNSVREEPLLSSWEAQVERGQGHTEAWTRTASLKGLLSEGCPTRSSHHRGPLSPWGRWKALNQLF